MILVCAVALGIALALGGTTFCGEVVLKEMVMGKEYRIEKVDGEPGNFWVCWGEEKDKWEPRVWQPKELKEQGPIFYYNMGKKLGEEEKRFPMSAVKPMQEDKITAAQFHDAYFTNNMIPNYMNTFQDSFFTEMYNVKGKKLTMGGFEFLKQYRQAIDYPEGEPQRKYVFVQNEPEESSGVGLVQIVYMGAKADDNFLYLPAVRKVRRLAVASVQDYIARSIVRNEDNALSKPQPTQEYKWTGESRLCKYRGKEYPGHGTAADGILYQNDPNYRGEDHTWVEGIGEPGRIMEVVSKEAGWWYGKQVRLFGLFNGYVWEEDTYDYKGRLIRQMVTNQGISVAGFKDPRFHWGTIKGIEQSTGFSCRIYSFNIALDVGIPDDFFQEKTLLKELKGLDAWR